MSYENLVSIREDTVDGIGPWHWITEDTGAWAGPKTDWENSHKERYFKYLRKKDIVICAGGNQGMYPRLFAEHFRFVYTFEPDPLNFFVLTRNCQNDNILKFQAALGDEPASVCIQRASMTNTGMHQVVPNGSVPQLTLDSFSFPCVDLIQLDVEGYEQKVLLGAMATIEKFKPVITCERAHAEIEKMLSTLGYSVVDQSVADTIYAPS